MIDSVLFRIKVGIGVRTFCNAAEGWESGAGAEELMLVTQYFKYHAFSDAVGAGENVTPSPRLKTPSFALQMVVRIHF